MNAYYDTLIRITKPNEPRGLITTYIESLKKLHMTVGELTPRQLFSVVLGDLVKLIFERATEEDELVKLVKGIDPQSIVYSLLPEDVKGLLKD